MKINFKLRNLVTFAMMMTPFFCYSVKADDPLTASIDGNTDVAIKSPSGSSCTVRFTANPSGGTPQYTYIWLKDGEAVNGGITCDVDMSSATVGTDINMGFQVQDANCNYANSNTITLKVHDAVEISGTTAHIDYGNYIDAGLGEINNGATKSIGKSVSLSVTQGVTVSGGVSASIVAANISASVSATESTTKTVTTTFVSPNPGSCVPAYRCEYNVYDGNVTQWGCFGQIGTGTYENQVFARMSYDCVSASTFL